MKRIMKKLVLTVAVLMAMATTSLAQTYGYGSSLSTSPIYGLPTAPTLTSIPTLPSVPSLTSSLPSTVNISTTTVGGYYRSNGTYVDSYVRTMPNTTNWDNFSTVGNLNPITGSVGSIARDFSTDAYNYGGGQTIHTGPRGGQYYYNSNGNKTYVPKRSLW